MCLQLFNSFSSVWEINEVGEKRDTDLCVKGNRNTKHFSNLFPSLFSYLVGYNCRKA